MKICYVNINAEKASRPFLSLVQEIYAKLLRPDTQMDIKSVSPGLERITDGHPYFYFLNKRQIIEKIIEAEREGYDAAVVGCFLDPGVSEARGIVNIPVIGLAESTMHFACQLGHKFCLIIPDEPALISPMEDGIRLHGLQDRVIPKPIRRISTPTIGVFTKGLQEPQMVASDIKETAKECVKDGADVVVIGCNGLAPFCTISGLAKLEKENIPIVDCIAVGLKTAEMLVDLRDKLGLPFISRAAFYALPREKDFRRVRALFGIEAVDE